MEVRAAPFVRGEDVLHRSRQQLGQAGDGGLSFHDLCLYLAGKCSPQLVAVAGQREERRMRRSALQRQELMPCVTAEADGKQRIRWDLDLAQAGDKGLRIGCQRCVRDVAEAQQGTAAAGDGREDAMPGVAVERMASGADGEGKQRSDFARRHVRAGQARGWFVQVVVERGVPPLPRAGVGVELVTCAGAKLGEQGDIDREAAGAGRRQADLGKSLGLHRA
ncbi:MAG: hypothetical protein ABWX87_03080 [Pseudoxanthomonas sp.]